MPRATEDLNYEGVHPFNIEKARESWLKKSDPFGVLCYMSNEAYLNFVWNNLFVLEKHGKLAKTLLEALISAKTNNSMYPIPALKLMIDHAGRENLLKASNKLPHNGPFELYRGVNGNGARRRIKGISWTSDFEIAKWFALRGMFWNATKPAVYKITAPLEWVYGYHTGRNEKEFILMLPPEAKPKCVWKTDKPYHMDHPSMKK